MKKIFFILISSVLAIFCSAQSNPSPEKTNNKQTSQDVPLESSFRSNNYISLSDAEFFLGHPAHVKDSLLKFSGGLLRYQFTYKANVSDSITGETGTLFFEFEQYEQTALAKRNYDLIKAENAKSVTVNELHELGDEAFLTKDQLNYPFIMIRKDKKIFKLKLHRVIDKTSLDKLQALAKKIVSSH